MQTRLSAFTLMLLVGVAFGNQNSTVRYAAEYPPNGGPTGRGGTNHCNGVWIGPRVFVTSAHCFTRPAEPSGGITTTFGNAQVSPVAVFKHAEFRSGDRGLQGHYDIAWVVFDRAVTQNWVGTDSINLTVANPDRRATCMSRRGGNFRQFDLTVGNYLILGPPGAREGIPVAYLTNESSLDRGDSGSGLFKPNGLVIGVMSGCAGQHPTPGERCGFTAIRSGPANTVWAQVLQRYPNVMRVAD